MKNIILCIDGEKDTKKAIDYAIEITTACNGKLTALHVINPYLKKFADEIYAVGRIEYSNHINRELRKEAEDIINEFKAMAAHRYFKRAVEMVEFYRQLRKP